MSRKRKLQVPPTGEWAEAEEIGFRSSGEFWNEYLLDDGTVVRMKLVVTAVERVAGQYDDSGNPMYLIQSTNVLNVSAPEDIRKKP